MWRKAALFGVLLGAVVDVEGFSTGYGAGIPRFHVKGWTRNTCPAKPSPIRIEPCHSRGRLNTGAMLERHVFAATLSHVIGNALAAHGVPSLVSGVAWVVLVLSDFCLECPGHNNVSILVSG